MRRGPGILRNLYVGQVLFGALAALLLAALWSAYQRGDLGPGTFGLALGLALLVLIFLVYLGNLYRFGLVPDYADTCPYCRGPVNTFSEFCEHCGADLVVTDLVACPRCGAESYPGTPHCPECGARLPRPPAAGA